MSAFSTKAKKMPSRYEMLKKVPTNPRYKNIKPLINSGTNLQRYLEKIRNSQQTALSRKDEIFKRIKLSTFVMLVVESAKEYLNALDTSTPTNDEKEHAPIIKENIPDHPSLHSIINGVGEIDLRQQRVLSKRPEKQSSPNSYSYLLLDIRDQDSYKSCHIVTAKNYPYTMLTRSYNYENQELIFYKNNPTKIIILYDEDESLVLKAATTFVQRGYDNIFVLTGGLKVAGNKFSLRLIGGLLPSSCNLPQPVTNEFRSHLSWEDIDILQSYLEQYPVSSTLSTARSSLCSSLPTNRSSEISLRKKSHSVPPPLRKLPWK